jgi:hypothetical protein
MSKRAVVFIFIGIILLIGVSSGGFFLYKNSHKVISPVTQIQPPTPTPEALVTWTDQSQFSFQYPKSLTLNPHDEDKTNYAHVELTSATHSGNLIVWTKDTTAASIDDWAKQIKVANSLDSTLGGEPAKIILTSEGNEQITLTGIHGGYLYQVEVNPRDSDYWNQVFNTVTSTYKFTGQIENTQDDSKTAQPPADSGSDDEEVVE